MVGKDIAGSENQTLREYRSVYLWQVIFKGQNIRGSAILVSMWLIYCCLHCQVKVSMVASFVGKIFVVHAVKITRYTVVLYTVSENQNSRTYFHYNYIISYDQRWECSLEHAFCTTSNCLRAYSATLGYSPTFPLH